jgi:hypothetical protein
MLAKVEVGDTDDPYFIALLDLLVGGLALRESPEGLWIIQIDNWFDHKWLRFSGIGAVDFRFPAFMNRYDGALDEFYQDKVTFPPFSPNRVMLQWSFAEWVTVMRKYRRMCLIDLEDNQATRTCRGGFKTSVALHVLSGTAVIPWRMAEEA